MQVATRLLYAQLSLYYKYSSTYIPTYRVHIFSCMIYVCIMHAFESATA